MIMKETWIAKIKEIRRKIEELAMFVNVPTAAITVCTPHNTFCY